MTIGSECFLVLYEDVLIWEETRSFASLSNQNSSHLLELIMCQGIVLNILYVLIYSS